MISPLVVSSLLYIFVILLIISPSFFYLLPIVPLPRYTCTRAVQQKREENGQETRTNRTMVLAQRVNAFTTRTESVEGGEKKKIGVSSRVFWNSCTCNRSMWKLRHWPPPLSHSFFPSFLLSFFFFSSLVFLSLSVPHRRISFALFFPRIFPSHHLVSDAREHCRPLSSQFPFLTSSGALGPSTLKEGSFFTGTNNSRSSKTRAVLFTFFRTYAFFLSSSLSPQHFPFVSLPYPLLSSSAVSPLRELFFLPRCTCRN